MRVFAYTCMHTVTMKKEAMNLKKRREEYKGCLEREIEKERCYNCIIISNFLKKCNPSTKRKKIGGERTGGEGEVVGDLEELREKMEVDVIIFYCVCIQNSQKKM